MYIKRWEENKIWMWNLLFGHLPSLLLSSPPPPSRSWDHRVVTALYSSHWSSTLIAQKTCCLRWVWHLTHCFTTLGRFLTNLPCWKLQIQSSWPFDPVPSSSLFLFGILFFTFILIFFILLVCLIVCLFCFLSSVY